MPEQLTQEKLIKLGDIPESDLEVLAESTADTPVMITYAVTADATSGLAIYDSAVPFDFEILDVVVQCTAANASGTLKLTDGTSDITDAIVCAVDKTIGRAGTIDDAKSSLSAGDTLKVVSNGAADRGTVTIIGKRS